MDPATANTLPMWAAYTIGGLGLLCGIFITFVLGLLSNRLSGGSRNSQNGGTEHERNRHDCANCTQIARVLEVQTALNQRIDNWMLNGNKGG